MPKNSAEYMRAYRARKKATDGFDALPDPIALADAYTSELRAEIDRLTEEVARLRQALAQLTPVAYAPQTHVGERNPYAEFHPAPKVRPKR